MWAKKNAVGKDEVAKLVEDTYRFLILLLLVSPEFDLYYNLLFHDYVVIQSISMFILSLFVFYIFFSLC